MGTNASVRDRICHRVAAFGQTEMVAPQIVTLVEPQDSDSRSWRAQL